MSAHQPLNFTELPPETMRDNAAFIVAESKRRRTIRDFSNRPIPDGVLDDCLRVAGTAPNGANLQPWHFTVIRDPAKKLEIRLAAEEEERAFYQNRASKEWLKALAPLGTNPDKPFLEAAPALIAIFAQPDRPSSDGGGRTPNYYAKESVGIATGFLISALHRSGLASLTHTPSPMGFLNRICNRPENEKPFLLLVVGYPACDATFPAIAAEKKSLEEIASYI
jgi:nitroreductase